jgi:hypothetical protein
MLQHLHALPAPDVILLRWPVRQTSCLLGGSLGLLIRILKHKNTKKTQNTKTQKKHKNTKNTKNFLCKIYKKFNEWMNG